MDKEKYLIIGIIIAGIVVFFLSGCINFTFDCEKQSRQELSACNTDCGEGIFSGVCKTNCTIEHNARIDQCSGNK